MKLGPLVTIILAVCSGLAGGYWIGRNRGEAEGRVAAGKPASALSTQQQRDAKQGAVAKKEPAPVAEAGLVTLPAGYEKMTLPEILDAAGPMKRFQAIMARVQRMPKGEILVKLCVKVGSCGP